jgi:hypothetical protein
MPDFDANKGNTETGDRGGDPLVPAQDSDLAAEEARSLDPDIKLPAARHLSNGHRFARRSGPRRRVGVTFLAQRRRAARRACPFSWRVRVLGTPLRHRRHLWTLCHRQPTES